MLWRVIFINGILSPLDEAGNCYSPRYETALRMCMGGGIIRLLCVNIIRRVMVNFMKMRYWSPLPLQSWPLVQYYMNMSVPVLYRKRIVIILSVSPIIHSMLLANPVRPVTAKVGGVRRDRVRVLRGRGIRARVITKRMSMLVTMAMIESLCFVPETVAVDVQKPQVIGESIAVCVRVTGA